MSARRDFIKRALAASLALPVIARASGSPKARVVVVGGGFGGATAAKYLRLLDPGLSVTLIMRDREYVACPMSNEVLIGERDYTEQILNHTALTRYGVNVVYGEADAVDPARKRVTLSNGAVHEYDKLVLAPGIDFVWNAVEGFSEEGAILMPHAYKAGAQTLLLKSQIEAMRDGGTFIIAIPPKPIRCPPAPYERASLVAHYFKQHKPKSKILIVDHSDNYPMQTWFEKNWARHYGSMITWVPGGGGGKVERVDMLGRTLFTEFDNFTGDVVNFIPKHAAGRIAARAGVTDETGFCPVDPVTLTSTLQQDIHIVGDAARLRSMAKTAHGAQSHAKIVAGAITAQINGLPMPKPYYTSVGYAMISPHAAFTGMQVLNVNKGDVEMVKGAGGPSPLNATDEDMALEARLAKNWYNALVADAFL